MERKRHREVPEDRRAAEHLANERTFLAWVRTNIALISLGFVLARLSLWLNQPGESGARTLTAKAMPLGVGIVAFGTFLTLLAAWRYHAVNREIETGLVKTDRVMVWLVTAAIAMLSATLITSLLLVQ